MTLKRSRGFTLIELLIVIAIVLVLVMVLIFAVLPQLMKGKAAKTTDLFLEIDEGISKWRDGERKAQDSFPKSGTNSKDKGKRYDGNMLLFRNLVGDPESKGRKPYVEVDEEMIRYLDKDGETIRETGDAKRRIFVDGFGNPLVYWEWKSKTQQSSGSDPTEGASGGQASVKELSLARSRGSYDIYSAGEDGQFGTADDMSGKGVDAANNPFKQPAPAEEPSGPRTQ
ncbi:MAG: prepilin-type N-terminal cleavage/methylation domain-containing protein [Planctomycetaceae bacterium]|nr:prepilin-type N-terminal cleavage/methylation domain-containing protein [Planctomycetaceae bacterium]